MATADAYDMLVLIDSTYSMATYLKALNKSLLDIIRISSLTACFSRIGVMTYGDYCGGPITQWSGWLSRDANSEITQETLLEFARNLRPDAGGDYPEATKTGLAHAYHVMRGDAKTIVLLYTDAPPHMPLTGGDNFRTEKHRLLSSGDFGQSGPLFADWVTAAGTLARGEKQAQVFAFVEPAGGATGESTLSLYTLLCEVTGGACLRVGKSAKSQEISELTVGVLLAWMGVEKDGAKLDTKECGKLYSHKVKPVVDEIVSEGSKEAAKFIRQYETRQDKALTENLASQPLSLGNMAGLIPRREPQLADFSKRYAADPDYRELVAKQMGELIETDVAAITVNPVFGSLWRAICNDRLNPMRDPLIAKFGLEVSKRVGEEKVRLNKWVEESYDRVGEVLDIIKSVATEDEYPCVFLDPTLDFSLETSEDGEKETKLTRDELLEIGRSCDPKILRRLGRVLTRLTLVKSKDDLPRHVKDVPFDRIPRVPLALAEAKYDRQFWKILLHCVVPGTMLGGRPASLLAALSVRMGIKPLEEAAYQQLLSWKDNWNTLDIPEIWNTSSLSLLLEVDEEMRDRKPPTGEKPRAVLREDDRKLFKTLVEYKMLELNLETTLTARIGWLPDRARVSMGPVVVCRACQYPRSVTMMSTGGICGMCDPANYRSTEDESIRQTFIDGHVSKSDNEATTATWVECAMTDCRAQYIVYFAEHLRVRPKCHYCRGSKTKAPFVECKTCLSRMVWPEEYRPANFDGAGFQCVGCAGGQKTIVDEETSAQKLIADNANTDWLLRNIDNKISQPFSGRSLFRVIADAKIEEFTEKVEVFPQTTEPPQLRIKGKLVRNSEQLVQALRTWVVSRRVEQGTCSLCFNDISKRNLRPACGRRGCKQEVCEPCMQAWYGINKCGGVINVAALCCPFCRRQPSTQAGIPSELRCMGGLKEAVEESRAGAWIYAWCASCGFAKQYMERVCAEGAPPAALANWRCTECVERQATREGRVLTLTRNCPGCGVESEKASGCDHVVCPVATCGVHWCFFCGAESTAEDIYRHMDEEHGSWGVEDDDYDEYD